jgi:dCMP deaminase
MQKRVTKRQRPNWDESFMFSALWAATRSSCLYLQTGAVIVSDKRIIASGYNGAPPGIESCLTRGCRKEREGISFTTKGKGVCRGIHAEINAMSQIARENLKGTTMYSLYLPCSTCAKEIAGTGIIEVVYSLVYEEPDLLTREMFSEGGIRLRQMDLDLPVSFAMIDRTYRQKRR